MVALVKHQLLQNRMRLILEQIVLHINPTMK